MKYLKLALMVALCTLSVACTAAKQDQATTQASTEWRIKNLEESFLNFREEQRRQADQNIENGDLRDQRLTTLEDKVAAIESGGTVVDAAEDTPDDMQNPEDKGWVTDLKPETEDSGWVDSQKNGEKPAAESGEEKPWDTVPGPPPTIPEPTVIKRDKPVAKKPTPKKRVARKPAKSSSQVMYDAALAKYNAEKYDAARSGFDAFLKKYPKSSLVPNALYWKGETYYSEKDYAQSILAFKEVTGRFPKHAKSAAALLKIGMSYDKVGDPDNAIFYLRALVEDFPGSGPAKLARKELDRLGG